MCQPLLKNWNIILIREFNWEAGGTYPAHDVTFQLQSDDCPVIKATKESKMKQPTCKTQALTKQTNNKWQQTYP